MNLVLTLHEQALLQRARAAGARTLDCSLDLGRSQTTVAIEPSHWIVGDTPVAYPDEFKDRTIYFWNGERFEAAARFSGSLIKLVPTQWGAPTFEIDGIMMLPTSQISPYEDARQKVKLIEPRGRTILDTCGGLGYFAAWCLQEGAAKILSFEINPDVLWLRGINPWSPQEAAALTLTQGDIVAQLLTIEDNAVDAILHDPPRFGIAGDLYSQTFYDQLARVLKPRGKLFHYTGTPNRLTTGRDVPGEVSRRLERAGFTTRRVGDGVLATKSGVRL